MAHTELTGEVLTLSCSPGGGGTESVRADFNLRELPCYLTLSYTGFFGLAGHGGGGGDGIHHTFITLVLFDGFELN